MTTVYMLIFLIICSTTVNKYKLLYYPTIILSFIFTTFSLMLYIPMPKMNIISNFFLQDLMSTTLCLLTIYLMILCYIISSPNLLSLKGPTYNALMYMLLFSLIICFSFKNIIWFYISFELALIPTILCVMKMKMFMKFTYLC